MALVSLRTTAIRKRAEMASSCDILVAGDDAATLVVDIGGERVC